MQIEKQGSILKYLLRISVVWICLVACIVRVFYVVAMSPTFSNYEKRSEEVKW